MAAAVSRESRLAFDPTGDVSRRLDPDAWTGAGLRPSLGVPADWGLRDAPTPVGTRFYGTSMSLRLFMVCVLGNVDSDYGPVIVGDLANRMPEIWPVPVLLPWSLPVAVETYGGFAGVHRHLFEQPRARLPAVASQWGNPEVHQP